MNLIPASEAAVLLEVDPSRVRALAVAGDLPGQKIAGRWLVDRLAVQRRVASPPPAGRPLSPRNAWQLLLLASGQADQDLSPKARWRLKRALLFEGLIALQPRLSGRGSLRRYDAHPGEIAYLSKGRDIVLSGISAARFNELPLVPGKEIEGYVQESRLNKLVKEHALHPAEGAGNVLLRIVPDEAWPFRHAERQAPAAAVALDLAESPDARSVKAGRQLLRRLDREIRG